MVTTKKVAGGSNTKKAVKAKTAKSKSVSKKTTKRATKKTTKNTTKKTTKKVTKKTTKKAAKKSTKRAKGTAASVKITAENRKSFEEKLAQIEVIHKNSSVLPKENLHQSLAEKKSVMVLSPYRFPVKSDSIIIQTARISGLFFVAIGAFFTIFYAQFLAPGSIADALTKVTNFATVCDASDPACDPDGAYQGYEDIDPESGCYYDDTACMDAYYGGDSSLETNTGSDGSGGVELLDPTPPAEIFIDSNEPLVGRVTIEVYVEYADSVILYVEDEAGSYHQLGGANEQADGSWHKIWDTTSFNDGDYKIKAVIINEHGSYEEFTDWYLVENNPVVTEPVLETGTSSDGTLGEVTEEVVEDVVTVSGSDFDLLDVELSQGGTVAGELEVGVVVIDAEKVKLSLRESTTGETTILGYAYQDFVDDTFWTFMFDSTSFVDGEYKLVIQAFGFSGEKETKSLTIDIKNTSVVTAVEDDVTNETTDTTVNEDDILKTYEQSLVEDTSSTVEPLIELDINGSSPISDTVDLRIRVDEAVFVEVYATKKFSGQPHFIGLADQVDGEKWLLRWDTTRIPNGEYKITAKVKNPYGVFVSDYLTTVIYNEILFVTEPEDETAINADLVEVYEEVEPDSYLDISDNDVSIEVADDSETTDDQFSVDGNTDVELDDEVTIEVRVTNLLEDYKSELDEEFSRLAAALRMEDEGAVDDSKERILRIKNRILQSDLAEFDQQVLIDRINQRIAEAVIRVEEAVILTEKIVKERTGEQVTLDSDNDGVSDYDEINIFKTDPQSADSDGDGFIDGAEILNGFDPKDDTPEAVVKYESPKDTGVVREDLLVVTDIVTAKEDEAEPGDKAEAIITGRGLPNSFVTLYIFSTPVVVTVKTEADGTWVYRFDKELEDGEHEVYVGVTDNAGKIIAKSEPFRFVKEAQAFSPEDAAAPVAVGSTDNTSLLLSEYMIYVVFSVSVVAVGLVLILLGLHLDGRKRENEIVEQQTETEPVNA